MRVPILKLKETLLVSIQMDLSDDDALQFQEDLVGKARDSGAGGVVIDITALDVVDSFLARGKMSFCSLTQLMWWILFAILSLGGQQYHRLLR